MKAQRFIASTLLAAACALGGIAVAQEAPVGSATVAPAADATPAPSADSTQPSATPTQSVSERLKFLLSGYEYFPSRADLDAVADPAEVAAQLRGFAEDADARPTLRLRAVDALGFYDDGQTVAYLRKLATTPTNKDLPRKKLRTAGLLRHHAISALVRSQRDNAVGTLRGVLDEKDTQLTLTVIHAYGKHGGEPGRQALAKLAETAELPIIRREARKWAE